MLTYLILTRLNFIFNRGEKEFTNASPRADSLVALGLQLIHERKGSVDVLQLLKRLHVSERQFERRFSRAVGIAASRYIRIMRFQEAVRLMKAGIVGKLPDMAHDLGYTDQSHFIKDVRPFTGYTPSNLVREGLLPLAEPHFKQLANFN